MTAAVASVGTLTENSSVAKWPLLSVIIPCRNEANFIPQCLDSIIHSNYPVDRTEILVVDGMSTDLTWPIICKYAERYGFIKVLRNAQIITAAALNLGIEASAGEIICRLDAHSRIAPDYLSRCVQRLRQGDADNVGGAMRTLPGAGSLWARSIALCMSHKFGSGNSVFRTGSDEPTFTDTVFGGCYRKEIFNRIGRFNEHLVRTQDMEFNQRLRKADGKILLDPAAKCDYFSSPNLYSFLKHNCADGIWSVLPFAYCKGLPVRWRHLVPLIFVMTAVIFATLGFWLRPFAFVFAIEIAAYLTVNAACTVQVSYSQRSISLLFVMPVVFAVRHFAYGAGSFYGLFKLAGKTRLVRRFFRVTRADTSRPQQPCTRFQ
jgi:glycosyltransferase involved in cell wall biosynthesis